MTAAMQTAIPPDMPQVRDWLVRLRLQQGLDAARQALRLLCQRFPAHAELAELAQWHGEDWWRTREFGQIRLERRGPEHFDFVWSVVLDRDFSARLKHIPSELTPRDLLQILTEDQMALLPDSRAVQWVVFHGEQPIGLSMFVNINFRNRSAEQIMGILPGHDHSLLVADAYFASLCFAYNTLGLNRVQGLIYRSNEAVALLQERMGFEREGVLRSAVWDEEAQTYDDLVQIALLRPAFDSNRFVQRYISRHPRDPFLMQRRDWPRQPLRAARE